MKKAYHDEDSADIQLDVVALLLTLKQIEGGALGDEENGLEFQLSFHREVFEGKVVFPIVGEGLVERGILVLRNVLRVSCPDGFSLVELLLLGALRGKETRIS